MQKQLTRNEVMKTTPIGPCYQCDYSFEFPLLYTDILHAIHFNWYVYLVKRFHESIAIDDNIWYNIYQGVSHNNEDTCILTFVLLAKESFTNKLIFIKKNLRWSVRCNVVNKMVMFKSVFVDIFITWFINCYLKPQEKPIHYILSENIVWMEN